MHDFPAWLLTEKVQVLISGALGGVVRWMTLREQFSAGMVSVAVGGICAIYLGPLVQPMFQPFIQVVLTEQVSRASFTGFVVGVGGISIAGFIIDVVRARRREAKTHFRDDGEPDLPKDERDCP